MTGSSPNHTDGRTPLAQQYSGPEPVDVDGSAVYPLYCAPLGVDPTSITLTLHSAAPPPELLGLGLGLSVANGHIALQGQRLRGVDVWTDALAGGAQVTVCAAGPDASFTLTPVWRDAAGTTESWTGNYGMRVQRSAAGYPLLHCSSGVGAPDFTELVVEVTAVAAPTDESRYRSALYDLGVAMHGRGDLDQACTLWTQAAGFGHAGAAYDLGVLRFRHGELDEAQRWWRTAADHGNVRAMTGLAEMLERQGNPHEAQAWRAYADGA